MDKKKLMLMIGALVVALGTALAARHLIAGGSAPRAAAMQAQAPKGPKVLVAQRALPVGTILTADSVTFQEWPKALVQDAYFLEGQAEMPKLLGTVVRNPITAGQPITQGSLVKPGDRGFLAAALGPGMRAVTIPVSARTGVAGFIFPGDHIDLMLTQSVKSNGGGASGDAESVKAAETILRNLRVLATDQSPETVMVDGKTQVRLASTVTLEVTPKVAEKIAVAETLGTISLTLRSIADNSADLEHALASATAKLPPNATKADQDKLIRTMSEHPVGVSGNSYTTGADVSRFAQHTVSVNAQRMKTVGSAIGQAFGQSMASVIGAVTGAGSHGGHASAAGSHGGLAGGAAAGAPTVHVTRGKATEDVSVETN